MFCGFFEKTSSSSQNFFSMSKTDYENHKLVIPKLANDSVITDSIPPQASELTFQRCPKLPRIV